MHSISKVPFFLLTAKIFVVSGKVTLNESINVMCFRFSKKALLVETEILVGEFTLNLFWVVKEVRERDRNWKFEF